MICCSRQHITRGCSHLLSLSVCRNQTDHSCASLWCLAISWFVPRLHPCAVSNHTMPLCATNDPDTRSDIDGLLTSRLFASALRFSDKQRPQSTGMHRPRGKLLCAREKAARERSHGQPRRHKKANSIRKLHTVKAMCESYGREDRERQTSASVPVMMDRGHDRLICRSSLSMLCLILITLYTRFRTDCLEIRLSMRKHAVAARPA